MGVSRASGCAGEARFGASKGAEIVAEGEGVRSRPTSAWARGDSALCEVPGGFSTGAPAHEQCGAIGPALSSRSRARKMGLGAEREGAERESHAQPGHERQGERRRDGAAVQ